MISQTKSMMKILLTLCVFCFHAQVFAVTMGGNAPDFTLKSNNGENLKLSEHQGNVVMINFWATWCGPCRAEIPAFSKFARNNPNIPVYGIAVDGTVGQLRSAQERLGIDYPVLVADEQVQQDYGVSTIPTTVVVGPDGSVAAAHAGIMLRPQLWWATR